MAIAITPVTAADGSFSAAGSTAWAAGMNMTMATARLLGRTTAGGGAVEEISVGSGLTLSAGSLSASGGSSTWDTIGAAAASTTTANGAFNIVYNTAPTADSKVAWTFGETSAATNGTSTSGVPNQVLLKLATLAASTQSPLSVYSRGNHVFSVSPSTNQILATNGTNSNPAYGFASALNTGLYWTGSNLVMNVGGVTSFYVGSGSITMQTQCSAQNGSAAVPGIVDSSAGNSGLYFATGLVGISISSATGVEFSGGASAKQALWGACTFANLGTPSNGAFAYCSDCDAPTLIDSTCTSVGGKTGSFAARVNGAWKCFT